MTIVTIKAAANFRGPNGIIMLASKLICEMHLSFIIPIYIYIVVVFDKVYFFLIVLLISVYATCRPIY